MQEEHKRRKGRGGRIPGSSGLFSGRVICGDCGKPYGRKVWHSNDKYKRVIWRCNDKFSGDRKCTTPHLTDDDLQQAFVNALNRLSSIKEKVIEELTEVQRSYYSDDSFREHIEELEIRREIKQTELMELIGTGLASAEQGETFDENYGKLADIIQSLDKQIEEKKREYVEYLKKKDSMQEIINSIKELKGTITEFDEKLWCQMADIMTVHSRNHITVSFKGGTQIQTDCEKT